MHGASSIGMNELSFFSKFATSSLSSLFPASRCATAETDSTFLREEPSFVSRLSKVVVCPYSLNQNMTKHDTKFFFFGLAKVHLFWLVNDGGAGSSKRCYKS